MAGCLAPKSILLRALLVGARLVAALLPAACDQSFSPFAPGARPFSVYGYLDPGADTQWIRVELVRTTVSTSSAGNGARVTLQERSTGRVLALRERVGRLPTATGADAWVHNFYTTERIAPGASYRFLALQPGGDSAWATVTVPNDYGVEVWLGQPWNAVDRLSLAGLRRAAFVTQSVSYDDSCGTHVERKNVLVPTAAADTQQITVAPLVPASTGCTTPVITGRRLWVAGTAGDWPVAKDYSTAKPGALLEPTNVSNALGFLGGVLTHEVPYESCQFASRPPGVNYCVLRYDSLAATVRGTAYDMWCADPDEGYRPYPDTLRSALGSYARVARVAVTLRELSPKGGLPARIRTATTDRLGSFAIAALEAGPYEISYFRDEIPDGDILEYLPVVDTVRVAQRQQLSLEVPLVGQVHCSLHRRFRR